MQRNQSKYYTLLALEELGEPADASIVQIWLEMQHSLDLTLPATKMALLRAHRQGLAKRKKGKYTLSDKGAERLDWLRQNIP